MRIYANRVNHFISCVNRYALGTKLLSDIDVLSYRQLAAILPFTKTSYPVIFRDGKHHFGHASTIMPYLHSLGNQTVTLEWGSEHNSKNMLFLLYHAIYNLFQLVTLGPHAEHISLYCVAGGVSDCQSF